MRIAKPTDWKTEDLPPNCTTIRLDRTFSPEQMNRIRAGLVPEQMEDKWFIYWKDDTLFMHRSWTGICVYVVRFSDEGNGLKMIEADANRDPEQCSQAEDANDVEMISYLIDLLLLHQEAAFPSDDSPSKHEPLRIWSYVGRAMLGQHPYDE